MEHHAGFETTAHIGKCQQHFKSFCHPTLSDVIDEVLETPQTVKRIDITPKVVIKDEVIHLENGIRINVNNRGFK